MTENNGQNMFSFWIFKLFYPDGGARGMAVSSFKSAVDPLVNIDVHSIFHGSLPNRL